MEGKKGEEGPGRTKGKDPLWKRGKSFEIKKIGGVGPHNRGVDQNSSKRGEDQLGPTTNNSEGGRRAQKRGKTSNPP